MRDSADPLYRALVRAHALVAGTETTLALALATFDGDLYIDYRARRPTMELRDGVNERVVWPEIELKVGRTAAGSDVVVLSGPEPDAAWRRFADLASERLWRPLGAGQGEFRLDRASGMPVLHCCFRAAPRDWLRLGALLHRGRTAEAFPAIKLKAGEKSLKLTLPRSWLDQHPLTRADLEQERKGLAKLGIRLLLVAAD